MRLSYSFFLSSANLRRRKLRSVLTIGGMALGVSLVVFLVSLGFGLQRLVRSQITNAEQLTVLEVSKGESTLLELDQKSVDKFSQMKDVAQVSPSIAISGQVANGDSVTDVAVYGVDPSALSIENITLNAGQNFSGIDKPEVIMTSTALNLIGLESLPKTVGTKLTIKILVPQKAADGSTEDLLSKDLEVTLAGIVNDDQLSVAYLPIKLLQDLGFPAIYTDAKVKVNSDKLFSGAKVKVSDQAKLPEVRKQIEALGYQVDSIADTVGQVDKIFLIFQFVVGGFGAIAMFVAAIGSLNTLTVSLLERMREIGLLKAFGATSGDIYRLFLTESVLIGFSGGVVGTLVGMAAGLGLNKLLSLLAKQYGGAPLQVFYTPPLFIAFMFVVVFIVSIVTGLYPSRRAAVIRVLDALRSE